MTIVKITPEPKRAVSGTYKNIPAGCASLAAAAESVKEVSA